MNTPNQLPSANSAPADARLADLSRLSAQDQAWLASLAGLSTNDTPANSTNKDTSMNPTQALQLRQYFAQRDALEAAMVLPDGSEARMLTKLRQQGVFETKQPITLGQRLTAALDWLLPSGPGAGPRYALVAGVALAVMVVPVLVSQAPSSDGDGAQPAPRAGQSRDLALPQAASVQRVLTPQPLQVGQQLLINLQQLGVSAQLQPQDQGFLLQAQVAPNQASAVQNILAPWGLNLPASGALQISLQPVAGNTP